MHCKSGADRAGLARRDLPDGDLKAGERCNTARRHAEPADRPLQVELEGVARPDARSLCQRPLGLAFEAWVRCPYDPTDIA